MNIVNTKISRTFLHNNKILWALIFIALLFESFCLFSKVVVSDAAIYSDISKNMLTKHWYILLHNQVGQLDKPHFMFWVQAIFYKTFGSSIFSYNLSGMVFTFIGAFYTYKLARYFYDKTTGLLAAVFCLNAILIITGSMEVKAEEYLLGLITPASYYLFLYKDNPKFRYLLSGALFTACAIMTKGVFLFFTVISGTVILAAYNRSLKQFFSKAWLWYFIFVLLFIIPECLALYLQFGSKGLQFYFWDGSFGRFFGFGAFNPDYTRQPILTAIYRKFSMTIALLIGFLPWSFFLLAALKNMIGTLRSKDVTTEIVADKQKDIYLLGMLLPTLLLFSFSKVSNVYYTIILIPFVAIITANWVNKLDVKNKLLFYFLILLSVIIIILGIIYGLISHNILLFVLAIIAMAIYVILWKLKNILLKTIIFLVFAINIYGISENSTRQLFFQQYDPAYLVGNYLSTLPVNNLYLYKMDIEGVGLHADNEVMLLDNLDDLDKIKPCYILMKSDKLDDFRMNKVNYVPLHEFVYRNFPHPTFSDILTHNIKYDHMTLVLIK